MSFLKARSAVIDLLSYSECRFRRGSPKPDCFDFGPSVAAYVFWMDRCRRYRQDFSQFGRYDQYVAALDMQTERTHEDLAQLRSAADRELLYSLQITQECNERGVERFAEYLGAPKRTRDGATSRERELQKYLYWIGYAPELFMENALRRKSDLGIVFRQLQNSKLTPEELEFWKALLGVSAAREYRNLRHIDASEFGDEGAQEWAEIEQAVIAGLGTYLEARLQHPTARVPYVEEEFHRRFLPSNSHWFIERAIAGSDFLVDRLGSSSEALKLLADHESSDLVELDAVTASVPPVPYH